MQLPELVFSRVISWDTSMSWWVTRQGSFD